MATSSLKKIVEYFTRRINNILMLLVLSLSVTIGMISLLTNYSLTTTTCDCSLPSIQEFHNKVSIVLYELIDQSELSWHNKLCIHYWDSITTVSPVVLKFSDISKNKNDILTSRSFLAFINGYLVWLKIYPSGSQGLSTISNYMSVYLELLKGPHMMIH